MKPIVESDDYWCLLMDTIILESLNKYPFILKMLFEEMMEGEES